MEAGADHYVVKGGSMRDLVQLAEDTLHSVDSSGHTAPVRDA